MCHLDTKIAVEYTQILETWGNITGMLDLDDCHLSDLTWASNENIGFLLEPLAIALSIDSNSMTKAKLIGAEVAKELIRSKRDLLLAASDSAVVIDKWENYNQTIKTEISNYRSQLRELTNQPNIFNVVWPVIPASLSFLNALEL